MAVKKKTKNKQKERDRHYCKVCGEHKANEKFSGKGHAAHICKKCAALPVPERNEQMALRKIENMAFRYLTEQEINWLRGKMNDQHPEVREAAREAHGMKFPRYERNIIKKGLTARSLEFYIHGEVWNEFGDEIPVHMRFFADNTGALRRIDYAAPEGEQETAINIGHSASLKFLKAVVHQLNAPFWSEDLSDTGFDDSDDPYYDFDDGDDLDLDLDDDDEGEDDEPETPVENKEPIWSLTLLLTKGLGEKTQTFYNQMHDEPQELFWSLMEWFEPDEDDSGDDFIENGGAN